MLIYRWVKILENLFLKPSCLKASKTLCNSSWAFNIWVSTSVQYVIFGWKWYEMNSEIFLKKTNWKFHFLKFNILIVEMFIFSLAFLKYFLRLSESMDLINLLFIFLLFITQIKYIKMPHIAKSLIQMIYYICFFFVLFVPCLFAFLFSYIFSFFGQISCW